MIFDGEGMESPKEEFQFEIESISSRIVQPILDIASDCACNLCYELGFESPDPIAFGEYYVYKL